MTENVNGHSFSESSIGETTNLSSRLKIGHELVRDVKLQEGIVNTLRNKESPIRFDNRHCHQNIMYHISRLTHLPFHLSEFRIQLRAFSPADGFRQILICLVQLLLQAG